MQRLRYLASYSSSKHYNYGQLAAVATHSMCTFSNCSYPKKLCDVFEYFTKSLNTCIRALGATYLCNNV